MNHPLIVFLEVIIWIQILSSSTTKETQENESMEPIVMDGICCYCIYSEEPEADASFIWKPVTPIKPQLNITS